MQALAEAPFSFKVCQITDSGDPGGAERIACLLSQEYARRGIAQETVLINRGWLLTELTRRGLEATVLESRGSLDLRWIRTFARFLEERKVDLVHGHLLDANFYASCAARLAGIPCVVTEHGDAAMGSKQGWRYTAKLRITQLLVDRVVVVSERSRTTLLERVRFGGAKTRLIFNGIPVEEYASGNPESISRRALGVPDDCRVVVAVGALTEVKAHHVLLKAHARLPEDVWCVLVGDGELRGSLEDLAGSLGTRRRVVFTGFREDVASILGAVDVLCLPSLSEGLPLILIEALAAGVRIVASDVGGIREVVDRAGTGILVEPNRPDLLEEALRRALADPPSRVEFPKQFRFESMADEYLGVYREVLSLRNGASEKAR
jgi:glycosyltransferase involved in cell wall biosynthesis